MPGIFGCIGCLPDVRDALESSFSAPYDRCDSARIADGVLGGHAFGSKSAVHVASDGTLIAIDGEASIYRAAETTRNGQPNLYRLRSGELCLTSACKGNIALVDPKSDSWYLATEWTGSFPLYYSLTDRGLVFSSRLQPLAKVLDAAPDSIGILEFLLDGYILAGRTHFLNINRLMPGQVLVYSPRRHRMRLSETSRLWVTQQPEKTDRRERVAESAWQALKDSLRLSIGEGQHALMMSAGWDSRTLLAALSQELRSDRLLAYTHGDLGSREVRLARAICESAHVELHREPLGEAMYDLERLNRGFQRIENIVFPHWHHAGAVLAKKGIQSVSAGVYGAVLGGHDGPAMLLNGSQKIAAVAGAFLNKRPRIADQLQWARDLLYLRHLEKPWYLAESAWDGIPHASDAIDEDIEVTLRRFKDRGILTGDRLIEAFNAEHRGSQFISAQILSCRVGLDIAMPFTQRELLSLSSRIPLELKIHNSINQAMLQEHAPGLLRFPCAATLVPARRPMVIQEASRLVRKLTEEARWRFHHVTRGRAASPRLGWLNVEFLRDGRTLNAITDDLRSDFWDRERILDTIARTTSQRWGGSLHPLSFQLMQIYTVDLMLR